MTIIATKRSSQQRPKTSRKKAEPDIIQKVKKTLKITKEFDRLCSTHEKNETRVNKRQLRQFVRKINASIEAWDDK